MGSHKICETWRRTILPSISISLTPLPVRTPYGRSKQLGERLVLESGLPAVVVRPSHVYGPGGWYVDDLIAQLRRPGRLAGGR